MTPVRTTISVVIPAKNEAEQIIAAVESAQSFAADQIIVVDGGSSDATVGLARQLNCLVIENVGGGRGAQLATGADHATGELLLFLHADNRLPSDFRNQYEFAGCPPWGGLKQKIDAPERIFRWLEHGNASRVRLRSMVFGDQAIFVTRKMYDRAGGFERIELMEDVRLSAKLRLAAPAALLAGPVQVNARRWQKRGVVRQTAINWIIQIAHQFGVSPETLRRIYG